MRTPPKLDKTTRNAIKILTQAAERLLRRREYCCCHAIDRVECTLLRGSRKYREDIEAAQDLAKFKLAQLFRPENKPAFWWPCETWLYSRKELEAARQERILALLFTAESLRNP